MGFCQFFLVFVAFFKLHSKKSPGLLSPLVYKNRLIELFWFLFSTSVLKIFSVDQISDILFPQKL